MKRAAACLALLVFIAAFAPAAVAEEVYLIGTVRGYEAGKSIAVEDESGAHRFILTEETEINGDIDTGMTVEVEATDGTAIFIGSLEVEEPSGQ
jgi:hypothetical protein